MQFNILQFQTCHCIKFLKPVKKIQPKERCNLGGVGYLKFPTLEQGCGWVVNCVGSHYNAGLFGQANRHQ